MPNSEKVAALAEIVDQFNGATATLVTEYRGLTVKQITDLRRSLGQDTTYSVVKNTLTRLAATQAGVAIPDTMLVGPTAIAFVNGDPVEAAKGLRDFARIHPLLVIKGGVFEGKALTAADVAKIAELESREVLLSKIAGVLKALPSRAAGLFQAPLSQVARLAKALEDKTPGEAAPVTAAADTDTAEAPAAPAETDSAEAAAAPAEPDTAETAEAGTAAADTPAGSEPGEAAPAE